MEKTHGNSVTSSEYNYGFREQSNIVPTQNMSTKYSSSRVADQSGEW